MNKTKKIKLILAVLYISAVCILLYFLFSKYSFKEITSYDFIKNNRDYFFELKEANLFFVSILFTLFSIIWIFAAGFASPLAIFAGFIFGKWLGLILLTFGMTIGATCLYIFANLFLKDFIKKKFLSKFKNLETKFKRSEFTFMLIYRFVGGIPFVISNVLPCIFNVKIKNFFLSTLLGMLPQLFLVVSIGSGLEKIIENNSDAPNVFDIIKTPSVTMPALAFILLLLLMYVLRKFFFIKK